MTAAPELNTNIEVPRSGCFAISSVGSRSSKPAIPICFHFGGKVFSDKYQAIIIGAVILSISEG
jgi:hypothetical protein